jgi:hypothetical protein
MTDPIDQRTAERERLLQEQLASQRRLARPEDYVFDKNQEAFWDLKDGTLHTEKAVDASIPIELWRVEVEEPPPPDPEAPPRRGRPARRRERLIPPSKDIMRVENDQFVENSTWWPGMDPMIHDWFIDKDGFRPSQGRRIYNQFRPPPEASGDATKAGPWIAHVKKLWPDPAEHEYFFDYCAHMVQRPHEKCNAGVVLSGEQRIGKDAALLAVKKAVGTWNVKDIAPDDLFSPYQPYLQTLMLVVNEVRPSKDEFHATSMYNILKPLMASPPETLPINDKYAKLRYVINVLRCVLTTNNYMDLYVPPGDGRIFIMHSALPKEWYLYEPGMMDYFPKLYGWIESGGGEDVGAWLRERDLSRFNPKGEVKKTTGWNAIAGSWEEPDDGVNFALDALGKPDVVFGAELIDPQFDYQEEVQALLKSPRKIAHRMQRAGYVLVPPSGDRWTFKVGEAMWRSRTAFVKSALSGDDTRARMLIKERGAAIAARRADAIKAAH